MEAAPPPEENPVAKLAAQYNQKLQFYLDKSTPHAPARWGSLAGGVLLYILRVWLLKGFYIVTYGLGIYNLNLFLGFITPQVDPELEEDGPALPTTSDQEFKPFVRRLPEMKFWCVALFVAVCNRCCFAATAACVRARACRAVRRRRVRRRGVQASAAVRAGDASLNARSPHSQTNTHHTNPKPGGRRPSRCCSRLR